MIPCNSHVDPVRTEKTGTQQILISHVCDNDERKSKGIIADKNLLQVCSMNESESESVVVNESSTEDIKSESIKKSINRNEEKGTIDKTDDGEP